MNVLAGNNKTITFQSGSNGANGTPGGNGNQGRTPGTGKGSGTSLPSNPIGALQEWCVKCSLPLPIYEWTAGQPHQMIATG